MILGLSIRECATEIEVGVKTSFYMRHRILDVINLSLKNKEIQLWEKFAMVELKKVTRRKSMLDIMKLRNLLKL